MNRYSTQILVFDGVELLDFSGPHEVLTACRAEETQRASTASPFEISLVSADGPEVLTNGNVRFGADQLLSEAAEPDIFIVPGGIGVRRLRTDEYVLQSLRELAGAGCVMVSVCTGALLLGSAGLLDGRNCTTHWMFTEQLQQDSPLARVHSDNRVVDDGSLVTGAGVTAGIDLSLRLVERFVSREAALATAAYIEYAPSPDYLFRR
ncbi:DJ-1/PfpI family protein [bacterium]|nr:DJ-1/PfpI family protein [bacterium]